MARPKKDEAKGHDAMLVMRLPAELKERIQAEAERRNMAASELVLTFARDGLERAKCITVVTRKQSRP